MADLLQQFNQNLGAMSFGKKLGMLLTLAGVVAATVVLWLWAQKPDFQVLYANLTSDDAGVVIDKLKEARVPYEVSAGGTAILVPGHQVHEVRMQLASQGLPQGGGVGFEVFDRTSIGTTEFVQKLNYRRALQGELSRTISQLSGVSKARVHLSIPEKSVFASRQESARASVVISLKAGRKLAENEVQGIVHLVASSVEGLDPQMVTIVDNTGRMLSKRPDSAQDAQMDYQVKVEKDIEIKIQTMLEKVVGSNKAAVRVTAVIDNRKVELTEEKFDPESQVIRSEQRSQDQTTSANQSAGAAPGVLSNVPPGPQPAGPQSTSNSSSNKKGDTVNYEINKSISHVVEPTGIIRKLSVAALVDGTYESATDPQGAVTRKYVPRNEEEMKKLEELVKKTMGFSTERGDQLEVVNVAFDAGAFEEPDIPVPLSAQVADFFKTNWPSMFRYSFGLLLALIVFLFVIRPIIKALVTPPPPPPPVVMAVPDTAAAAAAAAAAGLPSAAALSAIEQAQQLAKENPAAAANVVRTWLQE